MISRSLAWVLALLGLVVLAGPLGYLFYTTGLSGIIEALRDKEVIQALRITFGAGFLATLAALVTGVPLAYFLARYKNALTDFLEGLINLTVAIPHVAVGIMLLLAVGPGSLLGKSLAKMGLYLTDSLPAVVLAMWYVSFSYLVAAASVGFRQVPQELELVAANLGAGRLYTWRRIIFPLAAPAIFRGALLSFARSISEMGSLLILAYHPRVMTVLILERFQEQGLRASQEITAFVLLINLFLFFFIFWGLRRLYGSGQG
ncbi:ABC transporter permease subunit [Thermosulfuriphilus sp.]